ncbi:hypothetical protein BDQ17DRAFT_1408716 [Cyathus striatus]|nr:hypothetical protein BDQ17DRAFT_1408716 [Cyathus striatus]
MASSSAVNLESMPFGLPPEVWKNYLDGIASKVPIRDMTASLTRSHYIPSPSERASIEDLASSAEKTIQALKTELTYHQTAVELLQTRLLNTRTFLNFQRSLWSPMRNLPTELLSDIFIYVCAGEDLDVGLNTGSIWKLQQVCVRWQEVVQSTPTLWNTFKMEMNIFTSVYNESHVTQRVEACLEYSGNAPLTISILPHEAWIFSTDILDIIAKHAYRWYSFAIDADILEWAVLWTEMEALIQQHGLPRLRVLTVERNNNYDEYGDSPFSVFKYATALEEIHLYKIVLPDDSEIPCSQVKKLTMSRCNSASEDSLRSLLHAMPLLEELGWIDKILEFDQPPSQPIQLPSVKSLTIHEFDDEAEQDSWPKLCVPSLTCIEITQDIDIHSFISMLQRSKCTIKRLHLIDSSLHFLAGISNELHDLEELSLSLTVNSDILDSLVWNMTQILPSLRKLEVRNGSRTKNGIIVSLMGKIMRSRSSASIVVKEQKMFPIPLSFVKYSEGKHEHDLAVTLLNSIGDELGIKVEVVTEE